jgi:hypothetical protein
MRLITDMRCNKLSFRKTKGEGGLYKAPAPVRPSASGPRLAVQHVRTNTAGLRAPTAVGLDGRMCMHV